MPGTDTNIIEGPRKRRATERITENGDPLARKKAKSTPGNSINARADPVITPQASLEQIPDRSSRRQQIPDRAHNRSRAVSVITPQASLEEVPDRGSHRQHIPGRTHNRSRAADSSDDEAGATATNTQSTITLDISEVDNRSNNDDKESDDEPIAEDDISELSEYCDLFHHAMY